MAVGLLLLFLSQMFVGTRLTAEEENSFDTLLAPAFRRNCVRCHGKDGVVKGEVNLLALKSTSDLLQDSDLLGRVIEAIDLDEMPPPSEPTLNPRLRERFLARLWKRLLPTGESQGAGSGEGRQSSAGKITVDRAKSRGSSCLPAGPPRRTWIRHTRRSPVAFAAFNGIVSRPESLDRRQQRLQPEKLRDLGRIFRHAIATLESSDCG